VTTPTLPSVASRCLVRGRCGFPRDPRVHGRVTDGGVPVSRLAAYMCWSAAFYSGGRRAVCKTVGSAYVGSNPTPATTCENGPLAGNSRLCGPFFSAPPCVTLSRCRSSCCAVHGRIMAHSGRASVLFGRSVRTVGTVGAHRRRFHGRPRTGHASEVFGGIGGVPARDKGSGRLCLMMAGPAALAREGGAAR
jgi:hypothetical protein